MPISDVTPDQFYTDLIADLYEPLAGGLPTPEPYQRFIDRYGGPTLELGCGSGLPLLDLLELGYDVEGLDASKDMLRVCREKAHLRRLTPTLHHGLFQSFVVDRKFNTIYIPSASFTLLTNDDDAAKALERVHQHLNDKGALYLPLEVFEFEAVESGLSKFKEARNSEGQLIRVGMTKAELSSDGRNMQIVLRYEKHVDGMAPEVLERTWHRRCWSQAQMTELLETAGFSHIKVLGEQDQAAFVVIAEK